MKQQAQWRIHNYALAVIDGDILCDVYVAETPKARSLAGLNVVKFMPRGRNHLNKSYEPQSYWEPGENCVLQSEGVAMLGNTPHSYYLLDRRNV